MNFKERMYHTVEMIGKAHQMYEYGDHQRNGTIWLALWEFYMGNEFMVNVLKFGTIQSGLFNAEPPPKLPTKPREL
jgi:hypothetical protein